MSSRCQNNKPRHYLLRSPSCARPLLGLLIHCRVNCGSCAAGAHNLPSLATVLPRFLSLAQRLLAPTFLALVLSACHRENRYFEPPPASDASPTQLKLSPLVSGQTASAFREQQRAHYEENAQHVAEGQRLFNWFNCSGCHAHGGGDSGPPLMDDKWVYGGEIDQIYLTIEQGRPNGMPSFGGKIPPQQIWQIAAYVRTLSGKGPKETRPGRDEHIQKPSPQGRRDEPMHGDPRSENT